MPTTIRDIAHVLGVSHTTVSRVLNNRGAELISEATRQKVHQVARELGYRPNRNARALATGRTNRIALWMGPVYHKYYSTVFHFAERELRQHGFDLVYVSSHESALEVTLSGAVDGVLAYDFPGLLDVYFDQFGTHRLPAVSLGCYSSDLCDQVHLDLGPGMTEAVEYLITKGRQRIIFVANGSGIQSHDSRHAAYRATMERHGKTPEFLFIQNQGVTGPAMRSSAREYIYQYIKKNGTPDALCCFNEELAIAAFRALRDLDVNIPESVDLTGCDGIEESYYLDPILKTIQIPFEQVCQCACEFLIQRINNADLPRQNLVFTPKFIDIQHIKAE